jgi:hypothetical protein
MFLLFGFIIEIALEIILIRNVKLQEVFLDDVK